ncbi:MAG: glycosyltransferase [Muribaculaceae bacterium]|nr:glycosyltransferase [Muribaculaceae bacterium]
MRVLIVNKFWYPRGGDCVVAMGTASLLRRMGHEVAIFSMQHPDNVSCDGDDRFVPQVHFDGSLGQKLRAMQRSLGDKSVRKVFTQLLNDFQPQVVHLHNIHSYLSPVVAQLAHEHGCRVVWTMHDYKLLCPAYSCLRDGKPCDLCMGHPLDVVSHRCMKGSLLASIAGLIEATEWNRTLLSLYVDTFICPSQFMAGKMLQAGFPADKLAVVSNFIPSERCDTAPVAIGRAPYACYVGRLSAEKGITTLLQAATSLPFTLKVAGDGPLLAPMREQYASSKNIEFLGRQDAADVAALLRLARFSVMPSQWWENNPLSMIESLCAGTPVVGTDMGGIPELIDKGNGIIVPATDAEALASAMRQAWDTPWNHAAIARNAHQCFDQQAHYRALLSLYQGIRADK